MLEELTRITLKVQKIKEKVYKDEILLNPSQEQVNVFYDIILEIIEELNNYLEKYKDSNHVIITKKHMNRLDEEQENTRVSFTIDKMKETTHYFFQYFQSKDKITSSNFISSIDYTVFFSIRFILESLYRELENKKLDHTLDLFFLEKKIRNGEK